MSNPASNTEGKPSLTNSLRQKWQKFSPSGNGAHQPDEFEDPTSIIIPHWVRSAILIIVTIAAILLLRSLPAIVTTLLLGATLALILSFPVRFLNRYLSRRWSITIVTVTMFGSTIIALAAIIPFLISEISKFADAVPNFTVTLTESTYNVLQNFRDRGWIDQNPNEIIEDIRTGLLETAQTIVSSSIDDLLMTLTSSVSLFISAFGTVFVAIYLLVDTPKFKDTYIRMWAPSYRADARMLWDTMGFSLSRYLSALVVSLLIQGALSFIGLALLGVPYALILGIFQGVAAILPYVGAWIAAIPAVLIALTVSWQTAVAVAVLYLLINQLEGNLITPNLQGNAVKVHPILIFIAVIGGSTLFGLMGAVLAVPAIAIMRVLFEFFWVRIRVQDDIPTLLAFMRKDTEHERRSKKHESQTDADEDNEATDTDKAVEISTP